MPLGDSQLLVALFAHPDDEFAAFPWIDAAVRTGREVHCIWVTDGGWGGQDVVRRRNESIGVLRSFGVAEGAMHFLGERHGIRDGELYLMMDEARVALAAVLARLPSNARWLVPAWEGGHHDHDALHLLALELAGGATAQLFQYPLYNGAGLSGPLFRVLHPLPDNGPSIPIGTRLLQRLRYVLQCVRYRSQWKSFVGLLPFYILAMFRRHPFVVQAVIPERAMQRPHPGKSLYERRGGPSWEAFRSAVGRASRADAASQVVGIYPEHVPARSDQ